jgi:hypothetical protein
MVEEFAAVKSYVIAYHLQPIVEVLQAGYFRATGCDAAPLLSVMSFTSFTHAIHS